jgi:DNA polymerase-1
MKLLAIDGNSIMNRAFYGIRMLSNSKGFFTNAITGFMNIYLKEFDIVKPDCVAVAFDLKAPTFRHKEVASYKANRKGMPPELHQQMPVIKKILTAMGIKILEVEGYEADDILGTLSRIFTENGDECYILTGDRDSLQLVNDKVTVRLATTKETIVYTPEKIKEVYGIEPIQLIEVKALMGDSSDNIAGVAGIGEKTALSLIGEHGSIEKLYENIETAKLSPSVKTKLVNGKDSAFQSKWLATICKEVPIEQTSSCYKIGEKDEVTLTEILSDLEMFKLLEKLGTNTSDSPKQEVESEDKLPKIKYTVSKLDDETLEKLISDKVIIDFIYKDNKLALVVSDKIYTTDNSELILKLFESENPKRTFEAKSAYKYSFENNRELKNVIFMCDLAGYILNSMASEYTVQNLCNAYKVNYRTDMEEYADIASLPALCDRLKAEVELTDMDNLLYNIEQPLCEVLASMETYGVKVDIDGVKDFGVTLSADIKRLENEIYNLAGHEFNIGSPKQLGVVLFEELGLPAKKKTKTGYSTNADVLESLVDKHPIIPLILEYRTLTKLNSTYVEGLLKVVHEDGRVRSIFKQTETRTGRISSTEPNVQNIPVRKEIGRNMRKFFVAEKGYTLLDADYSQIELRVLAHVCGDKNMQSAFLEDKDIHTTTAAQVFGVPEDFVSPEMRSAAKAVNFGIIYGIGAFSLSQDIGVTVSEADKYIKNYLANYPNVAEFMEKTVEGGKKDGYVTTIFGRRRYIPELLSSNKILQAFGKRAAMNAPIQGAAADIIKIAMVKVYKRLKEEKLDARLILQVHDELIVEASLADKDKAAKILHEEMENAVKLDVPMTADVNEGESWYVAKG